MPRVCEGDLLVLRGLVACRELNGRMVEVKDDAPPRLKVMLGDKPLRVKPENLQLPLGWCHECNTAVKYNRLARDAAESPIECTQCQSQCVEALASFEDYRSAVAYRNARFTLDEDAFGPCVFSLRSRRAASGAAQPQPQPQPQQRASAGAGAERGSAFEEAFLPLFFELPLEAVFQGGASAEPVSRGAAQRAIEALQRVTHEEGCEGCCAVCQDDFASGDKLLKMPCGHLFHDDCLLPWLKDHNTCPTCRHEIPSIHSDPEEVARRREAEAEHQQELRRQHTSAGPEPRLSFLFNPFGPLGFGRPFTFVARPREAGAH